MKYALALAFLSGAAAFSPLAKAPVTTALASKQSTALPYTTTELDTGLAGDFGFDPFGLAGAESKYPPFDTLRWYREAELQHGRVAQLAIVGFLWPQLFGTFPTVGGYDYSELNPIDAFYKCPSQALVQITIFIGALEGRRYLRCIKGDSAPGDVNLAVPGGFNPLNLDYSDEEYAELELKEIKHCRLAMIAAIGALVQTLQQGEGVGASLSKAAFGMPEFSSKAGYFFPDGL
mmetsp:Transcript_1203/g.2584  ORF Transcript_1203/g.2584 Transcript_1203/m.2584 type:complete len:233 (-) Transcript_1203:274-972(-)